MALSSFRFLHAADFRLDTPCFGVPHLPDELRDRFVDARYAAARRVFDTAIEQEVDFIVLAGGLLDPRLPGLRGPLFLIEQFERLAAHGIDVYWAGATFETQGRWPSHAGVPANLRLFAGDQAVHIHHRGSCPLAQLRAVCNRPANLIDGGLFTIMIHPRCTSAVSGIDTTAEFWALGGQTHRDTRTLNGAIAHFPGSPQGRTPSEIGPHGCSLVMVNADGDVNIEPIATDIVRWCREEFTIGHQTTWSELEQQFDKRLNCLTQELQSATSVDMAIVNWTLSGSGLAVQRLLQSRFQQELIGQLNDRHRRQAPALWNLEIDATIDAQQLSDWQNEQSSLGAFLRELDQMSDSICVAHPPKISPELFNGHLRRQVVNEGIHRLTTESIET